MGETACVCDAGACRLDMMTSYDKDTIPRSQAMDIARKLLLQEGYEWKDVSVEDGGSVWLIRTGGLQRGGNAEIRIDKSTGKVLKKHFNPE